MFASKHGQFLQDCDQILVADLCLIDQLICQDENVLLSFEAICSIHKLMDEDDDGTVDMTETDEVKRPPRCGGPAIVR